MLPLDDAVVVQLSLGCLHDGVLLPGDLKQSGAGEALGHMTDNPRQQLVGREAGEGADCIFHSLRRKRNILVSLENTSAKSNMNVLCKTEKSCLCIHGFSTGIS